MDLATKLDRALGLEVLFEQDEPVMFTKTEWMTTDPKIVHKIAATNSISVFWKAVREMAIESGDQYLADLAKNTKKRNMKVLKQIRKEARRHYHDVIATAGKHGPRTGLGPEQLGWTEKDKEEYYAKRREKYEKQPQKKYLGDTAWGIYQDNKILRGGFETDADAEIELMGDPEKYPNPDDYEIKEYDNPKSLSVLRKTIKPIDSGWTADEIVAAMQPYAKKLAWKWKSDKTPYEDLLQQANLAILYALETDAGIAPFASHAYRRMSGEIKRLALTGGVIGGSATAALPRDLATGIAAKHGEAGVASFKQRGGLIGYDLVWLDKKGDYGHKFFPSERFSAASTGRPLRTEDDPGYVKAKEYRDKIKDQVQAVKIGHRRGGSLSADAPTRGGEGVPLAATIKGTQVKNPAYIAKQREIVKQLKDKANLTPKQAQVLDLFMGFDVPEAGVAGPSFGAAASRVAGKYGPQEPGEKERKPGEQAGEPAPKMKRNITTGFFARTPSDVAAMAGIGRQRVSQHVAKALTKLCRAAGGERSDFCKELLGKKETTEEDYQKGRQIMLAESVCRQMLVEMILTGDINYAFIQD